MMAREDNWQEHAKAQGQTVFNFGGPHSDTPGDDDLHVLRCPACGTGYRGVHVVGTCYDNGGYMGSVRAHVALKCEYGCLTELVFGTYKGNGYTYWKPR